MSKRHIYITLDKAQMVYLPENEERDLEALQEAVDIIEVERVDSGVKFMTPPRNLQLMWRRVL